MKTIEDVLSEAYAAYEYYEDEDTWCVTCESNSGIVDVDDYDYKAVTE